MCKDCPEQSKQWQWRRQAEDRLPNPSTKAIVEEVPSTVSFNSINYDFGFISTFLTMVSKRHSSSCSTQQQQIFCVIRLKVVSVGLSKKKGDNHCWSVAKHSPTSFVNCGFLRLPLFSLSLC